MNKLDFFNTIKGQYRLHTFRKYRKLYITINTELKSKNSISLEEKINFQKIIINEMINFKRRAFKSPIIIKLDFSSSQDNPPAIHTLAKCYLDLLEQPLGGTKSKRKNILYENDRQIKGLIINYHIDSQDGNEIRITADNFSNFLKDIELYKKIENNDFINEVDYDFKLEKDNRENYYDNPIDKLNDFIRDKKNKDALISKIGIETYKAIFHLYKSDAQKYVLKLLDIKLEDLIQIYSLLFSTFKNKECFNAISKDIKPTILSSWFSIDLGIIPEERGDTIKFRENVINKLHEYKVNSKNLFPLNTLLSVTILLVSPKKNGIDLDNLARKIIPFINDILKPPYSYIDIINIKNIKGDKIKQSYLNEMNNRPKIPVYSITRFQIFEIPSINYENNEGTVKLFLGDGFESEDIWGKLNDNIDKWEEYIDRRW